MATAAPDADPLELRLLYSPHKPEPPQHAFLLLDELGVGEALYGGAAGGGKSDAILMSALRYVDIPGYAALILRRSYPDLALPGAIMHRSKSWLIGEPGTTWSERDYRFTFATGEGRTPASVTFGYLQHTNDRYRYASAEFQFVGFDELTQFAEEDYTFLFSRLRGPSTDEEALASLSAGERAERELLAQVPLRMRTASNPGGRGHVWVRRRFIERLPSPDDPDDTPERARRRIFIPAKLDDNPHVDKEAYRRNLANLTAVERARLEDGDWWADDGTLYFDGNGLDAAVAIGEELDYLAARGEAPPPVGGKVALGVDWGDNTHYVYIWPLEAGGVWLVLSDELVGLEPGAATGRILDALGDVPAWEGLGVVREPLEVLEEERYDAAGLQSNRTFAARARQRTAAAGLPPLRTNRINFNQYKRATALYLKLLVERARDGHRTRILAVSPRCTTFLKQARALRKGNPSEKGEKDPELWVKVNDHGPDALVAAAAPIAKANRRGL
jgi:hypothetical protein